MPDSDQLETWVQFQPAYDCIRIQPCVHGSDRCEPGAGGSHGIHSATMAMYVRGELGVVSFTVYTGWFLDVTPGSLHFRPMPADLGYHSHRPIYNGQEKMDCPLLPEGICYYDGSALNAERPWKLLRERGSDAVWEFLKEYYGQALHPQEADNG